jgi:predicted GIY-YIG superfamily endonuclease
MYTVYILLCADDSLYTGITNDLERRFLQHQAGIASRYTRSHPVVKIVYQETCANRSEALKREAAIKRLSRTAKLQLITARL